MCFELQAPPTRQKLESEHMFYRDFIFLASLKEKAGENIYESNNFSY